MPFMTSPPLSTSTSLSISRLVINLICLFLWMKIWFLACARGSLSADRVPTSYLETRLEKPFNLQPLARFHSFIPLLHPTSNFHFHSRVVSEDIGGDRDCIVRSSINCIYCNEVLFLRYCCSCTGGSEPFLRICCT